MTFEPIIETYPPQKFLKSIITTHRGSVLHLAIDYPVLLCVVFVELAPFLLMIPLRAYPRHPHLIHRSIIPYPKQKALVLLQSECHLD